jgi:pyruvate, water dikinase
VRSSATAEDLPDASFAGQHDSFMNIKGPENTLEACKKCFASLFTDRAIRYRELNGFDHMKVALSAGVQKMVRSDKASAGVAFTILPESGYEKVIFLTGSWGLGDNVVQGAVNADEFYIFKPSLKKGMRSIISKNLGTKEKTLVYAGKSKKAKIPL